MTGDEIGTWKVAASRIEAALLIQPGWDVRLVDGESGEAIRFERTSAEYSETWTEADGAACCGGLIGTVSFSPKVVRDDFLALKSTQEKLAFFGKYGPFTFAEDWKSRLGPNPLELYEEEMGAPPDLVLATLPEIQASFREALLNPPASWRPRDGKEMGIAEWDREFYWWRQLGPLPLKEPHPGRPPYDTMTACCVREAMATADFLDVYTEEHYKECEQCNAPFQVNSERGQRFCNESCAGKARVARSRKKRRAAARATGSVAS